MLDSSRRGFEGKSNGGPGLAVAFAAKGEILAALPARRPEEEIRELLVL
jgi:hypothetical protein